jgi:hypothetical protein
MKPTAQPTQALPVTQTPELFSPSGEKPKRGHRLANESNVTAIHSRLASWLREPEDQRPSLRALAIELSTSHQLLSFYLKGQNDWQQKEYKRRAKAIIDQAHAENRFMTPWEESQVRDLERWAFCCRIDSILQPMFQRWEANAKARTLSKQEHSPTIPGRSRLPFHNPGKVRVADDSPRIRPWLTRTALHREAHICITL